MFFGLHTPLEAWGIRSQLLPAGAPHPGDKASTGAFQTTFLVLRNRSEYSPVKQAVQPFVDCKKQGFQDFTQVAIYGMKFDYHGIIIFIMGLYANHKHI